MWRYDELRTRFDSRPVDRAIVAHGHLEIRPELPPRRHPKGGLERRVNLSVERQLGRSSRSMAGEPTVHVKLDSRRRWRIGRAVVDLELEVVEGSGGGDRCGGRARRYGYRHEKRTSAVHAAP